MILLLLFLLALMLISFLFEEEDGVYSKDYQHKKDSFFDKDK